MGTFSTLGDGRFTLEASRARAVCWAFSHLIHLYYCYYYYYHYDYDYHNAL